MKPMAQEWRQKIGRKYELVRQEELRHWKLDIRTALEKRPLLVSDLMVVLGFSLQSTYFDNLTSEVSCGSHLEGSFSGSVAQQALRELIESRQVVWQRAADMKVWYGLEGQKFPRRAAPRSRTLKQFVEEVTSLLPADVLARIRKNNCVDDTVEDDDVWAENLSPFTISMEEDGWSVDDADHMCGGGDPEVEKEFPMDVEAQEVANFMAENLDKAMSPWDDDDDDESSTDDEESSTTHPDDA